MIRRIHDHIAEARRDREDASDRFGAVVGHGGDRLPAPAPPDATIRPRSTCRRTATASTTTPSDGKDPAMTEQPAGTQAEDTPTVVHVPDRNRYEIHVGDTSAGLTAYRDRDDRRVFYHTKIDDAFGGRGLAARLVHAALDDVRASGKRIVPVCPYVKKYLEKHDGYADITDPVTPEVLQWLDARLAEGRSA
ncbi:GNAT family N-acetyltransferase [Streptomyces sp. NPDC050585]|uniref:GNAT family N-acetyltransferase n=2 Tax=unclassified Streptomyces TaxID=2593676 RepID=UPI0037B2FA8D